MDLEQITARVVSICRQARTEVILPFQQQMTLSKSSKDKTGRNFVTEADQACEAFLIEALGNLLPEAGLMAEESYSGEPVVGLKWVIDPIDGTTNFMHSAPPYCISVALADDQRVLVGVILELFADEAFYAWYGGGAYCDRKRLAVSKAEHLEDALLVTGFPYMHGPELDTWMDIFKSLLGKTHGVRRLGAAAVDMAYVAAGRFEAFFEYNLEPWDVAAGAIIVLEAGGQVSDFGGGDNWLYGKQLLCTNGHVHSTMVEKLKPF